MSVEDQGEADIPDYDLKRSSVEVQFLMPFCEIHICGKLFAKKLKNGKRVDCTCVDDTDYRNNDECTRLLQNFEWLADQIHAKRSTNPPKGIVWVNCQHGQVRSVITVGVFLIKYGDQSLAQALGILRRSRGERWEKSPHGVKVTEWLTAYAARKDGIQAVQPIKWVDHDA